VLRNGFLSVVGTFDIGLNYDYFTVGTSTTRLQTPAQLNNRAVVAGTPLNWRSDGSVTNDGFTICASSTPAPTLAPTAAPTHAPTDVGSFICRFTTPVATGATQYWCGMTHTNQFRTNAGRTGSTATGASGGQANTTTDRYAYIETSSGAAGDVSMLQTPPLASPSVGKLMEFYYHMAGATIGNLTVQTCVGTMCTTQWTQTGAQHAAETSAWTRAFLLLVPGTTSVKWIATRGTSFTGDISIDSISIAPGNSLPTTAPTVAPTRAANPTQTDSR
jgi:hypothetical protein